MPILTSTYHAPFLLRHKHWSTVYSTLFRKVKKVPYQRVRTETPDQDFIDLDFSRIGSKKLVIVLHGLEGSSESKYTEGLITALNRDGLDAVVLNHRGCSGTPNRLLSSYHSGKTDDLHLVVQQCANDYDELYLVGFSLGGNVVLKYTGESGDSIHPKIKKSVGISVPCDLKGSATELRKRSNRIYMQRFLKTLKAKSLEKLNRFPESNIDPETIRACRNFFDYDAVFTAPVHGFKDAYDYWEKSASRQFIPFISIPTLLINAKNDPFLSQSCFPYSEAKNHKHFYLETPVYGGHVGFKGKGKGLYWLEQRITRFITHSQ